MYIYIYIYITSIIHLLSFRRGLREGVCAPFPPSCLREKRRTKRGIPFSTSSLPRWGEGKGRLSFYALPFYRNREGNIRGNDRFLLSKRREEKGLPFSFYPSLVRNKEGTKQKGIPVFSGQKARKEGTAVPSLHFPSKGVLCKVSQTISYIQYIYIYVTHIIYIYIYMIIFYL